jgi:hypothetical protein
MKHFGEVMSMLSGKVDDLSSVIALKIGVSSDLLNHGDLAPNELFWILIEIIEFVSLAAE